MLIKTTRFGSLEVEPEDLITFPAGLLGLEDCREWILLADAQNDSLGWLQSVLRAEIALAVVSPRRFVPQYQMRVARAELAPLELPEVKEAQVVVIVGKTDRSITLNLKAPLVINAERRLGRQVIVNGDQPVQYELPDAQVPLKKSA
ncbi:MAG: flagellar assembly protein FliW [Pirellulales bacterium]